MKRDGESISNEPLSNGRVSHGGYVAPRTHTVEKWETISIPAVSVLFLLSRGAGARQNGNKDIFALSYHFIPDKYRRTRWGMNQIRGFPFLNLGGLGW